MKRHVLAAIRIVAERLRNTPAVCRSSYIHPAVLDAYVAGTDILPRRAAPPDFSGSPMRLTPQERAILRFLRRTTRTRKR